MRLFECRSCGNAVHFDNVECLKCGAGLGFSPDELTISSLTPEEAARRYCANHAAAGCNWLVPPEEGARGETLCRACRHNRVIPDLDIPENVALWRVMEAAKRRSFYSLLRWRLPPPLRDAESPGGLAFDFLTDHVLGDGTVEPVMTSHADGVITVNLAEADDAERERRRVAMGEPYRTLIGHFRHEIGHFQWNVLVRDAPNPHRLEAFRAVFGDERADYGEALARHHAEGPPPDWAETHISAYATAHPWEDFAETWAHHCHIVDTLDTARAFGLSVTPEVDPEGVLSAEIDFDAYDGATDARTLVTAWRPLAIAVNGVNQSMGQPDLYPFVLTPAIEAKLEFIREIVHSPTHGPTRTMDRR